MVLHGHSLSYENKVHLWTNVKTLGLLHWSLGNKKNSENWCNIGPSISR